MSGLLPTSYDPMLVALSMGVATLASFVSLDVAARIWPAKGWPRAGWITAAATAMGGGIWSMHFIAMLAFSLPVEIGYDVPTTLASLVTAIVVTGLAFAIIAEGYELWHLVAAGILMGLGVAAMHYTGMAAMRLAALVTYVPWLVAASVLIACIAATAALGMALRSGGICWRTGAALIMGVAVYGMHYTGMSAACFTAAPWLHPGDSGEFQRGSLALIVALATMGVLSLAFLSAAVDRRFAAYRARETEILRLSARRFQNLVQSSNDLILVVDRVGRIQFAAPSSRSIGRDPSSLDGTSVFDLVGGPGVGTLAAVLAAEEERSAFAFVDRLQMTDGGNGLREYEATACNLLEEPSVRGIVLTFHDVTERERSAAELRRAKRLSEDANRLKSEFIANMNHELRTPLNAILGFSELIMMDEGERLATAAYREYARDIHRSGTQLLAIINDILDFSKAETGQITLDEEIVDAASLVAETVRSMLPAAAKKNIRLEQTVSPTLPRFRGDARRLRQILLNLLSNAVKFTPERGAIVVRATLTAARQLEISVEDTGIGIPDDKIPRVTEPFYQVDGSLSRHQEGTGLGLAIAKSLAELHQGSLVLTSEMGRGTKASVLLPEHRVVLTEAA